MSGLTIYHNPRCSKSRQTLALIEQAGVSLTVIKYLETPLTKGGIKKLLEQLDMTPRELLRKGEEDYKALGLSDTSLSDAKLIEAMVSHPKLIERPIVSNGSQAVLGRPPENVKALL